MKYADILEEIERYDRMTSEEIQNDVKPIIKSYSKNILSYYLNVSPSHLFRICKKMFVDNNERLKYDMYVKIMAIQENPEKFAEYIQSHEKEIGATTRNKNNPQATSEQKRKYQHEYYLNVTKKKRQIQKLNRMQN